MSTTAKDTSSGDYELIPQGTHIARCVQVIDMGEQFSDYYQKWSPKVLIGWELPEVMREVEGEKEPALIRKRYTCSLHENAWLRKHLQSWRGKAFTKRELAGFNLKKLLDVPCIVTITHDESGDRTYSNVDSVSAVMKSMTVPDRHHELIFFNIDEWDDAVFETFSEKLQERIKSSREYQERNRPAVDQYTEAADQPAAEPAEKEDIPFIWLLPFIIGGLSYGIQNLI